MGYPVALAYIDCAMAIDGADVFIDIAGTHYAASVSRKAHFDPDGLRMRQAINSGSCSKQSG